MPRQKRDTSNISLKLDKEILRRFRSYADSKGQSYTVAIERILKSFLDREEEGKDKTDDR